MASADTSERSRAPIPTCRFLSQASLRRDSMDPRVRARDCSSPRGDRSACTTVEGNGPWLRRRGARRGRGREPPGTPGRLRGKVEAPVASAKGRTRQARPCGSLCPRRVRVRDAGRDESEGARSFVVARRTVGERLGVPRGRGEGRRVDAQERGRRAGLGPRQRRAGGRGNGRGQRCRRSGRSGRSFGSRARRRLRGPRDDCALGGSTTHNVCDRPFGRAARKLRLAGGGCDVSRVPHSPPGRAPRPHACAPPLCLRPKRVPRSSV